MFLDNELEIFIVIAKTKSFSQTAKKLHMSRPALTNRTNLLESKYGTKFYIRHSQGVDLTEAGEIITEYARRIIKLKKKMDEDVAALHEAYIPSLVIGASIADGAYLIPNSVKNFLRENPGAKLHIDIGYEEELLAKMNDFVIDFAVIEDQCNNSNFECELLGYKRLICLAPNTAPWNLIKQPLSIRKLTPLPMIIYEWDSGRHYAGDRHFRGEGFKLSDYNVVVRMDSYEAMIQGILNGIGYGWFPEVVAEHYLNNPKIIRMEIETEPVLYQVNLVYNKMHELSGEAKSFIKILKESNFNNYFEAIYGKVL